MSFHSKPLDDLTEADIDALVGQDETGELDFKLELPGGTDKDKLEFVTDVCSMSRGGGDIVFGVHDEEGVAVEIRGLAGADLDATKVRLDQLVESWVEPRLPSVQFGKIDHPSGPVLVLRIAKSWQGPHGVRVGEGFRFPIRGASARKTYLDFEQLRSEFAGGEELRERVRAFRDSRVAANSDRRRAHPGSERCQGDYARRSRLSVARAARNRHAPNGRSADVHADATRAWRCPQQR